MTASLPSTTSAWTSDFAASSQWVKKLHHFIFVIHLSTKHKNYPSPPSTNLCRGSKSPKFGLDFWAQFWVAFEALRFQKRATYSEKLKYVLSFQWIYLHLGRPTLVKRSYLFIRKLYFLPPRRVAPRWPTPFPRQKYVCVRTLNREQLSAGQVIASK